MAVVSVEETPESRGGYDDEYQREYTRTFEVLTDDEDDGPITVEFAAGIPRVWDAFVERNGTSGDAIAVCRKVSARRSLDDPLMWVVTCEFSISRQTGIGAQGSAANRQPGGTNADDPTKWAPQYSWGAQQVKVPFRKDRTGRWVLNSAGDPYDPLPELDASIPTLTVSRYQAAFNAEMAKSYAYAVNADTFLFADPGQARLQPITAESEATGGVLLWKVRITVEFMTVFPYTWQPWILDAGYRRVNLTTGKNVAIIDELTKQPVQRPVPLNGLGQELSRATLVGVGAGDGPQYGKYTGYPSVSFAELELI